MRFDLGKLSHALAVARCGSFSVAIAKDEMLNSDVVWVSSPLMGGAELASSAAQKLHIASGGQLKPSRFCIASVADRMRSPAATNIVADLKRLVADSLATV